MRIVKLGLISAVVLFLMIYIMSLFIPSHIRISRAIDIAESKDSVARTVGNMTRLKRWNEFVQGQLTGERTDHEAFHSDQLTVQVVSVTPDSIKTVWQQPGRTVSGGFSFTEQGGVTVVQWYFDFHQRWYPWEKFASIVFDSQFGPPMERSLSRLKKLIENSH